MHRNITFHIGRLAEVLINSHFAAAQMHLRPPVKPLTSLSHVSIKPTAIARPLRRTHLFSTSPIMSQSQSQSPMEDAIRSKLTTALAPSLLQIHNDSHLHAHHKAMAGSVSRETHFRYFSILSTPQILFTPRTQDQYPSVWLNWKKLMPARAVSESR